MPYRFVIRRSARKNLADLKGYITRNSGQRIAIGYINRLLKDCQALTQAPERGALRMFRGEEVRMIGFERRVAMYYIVHGNTVAVLAVHYAGFTGLTQ